MIKKTIILLILISNIMAGFVPEISNITTVSTSILSSILLFLMFRDKPEEIVLETPKTPSIEETVNSISQIISQEIPIPLEENSLDYIYSEKVFYIKECISIIENLSINTRRFEEETLLSLFEEFEEIWENSDTIFKDSETSLESIFDTRVQNNLGHVINASNEINNDFTKFMPVLNILSQLTDKFIRTSIDSFNTITKTTKDIVELAEHVKVISINVRIEAARVKDSGGFKILGNDISNFAEKTSTVALSTNKQIKETMDQIENLKQELSSQLHYVEKMAQNMYVKVSPFENILKSSSESVMNVIKNLNTTSGQLQDNLKYSISKLQYQDITNQETDHILMMLKQIEEVELNNNNKFDVELSNDKKREIRIKILDHLKEISTTASEESEIVKLSKKWNIELDITESTSGKSINEGVFLF